MVCNTQSPQDCNKCNWKYMCSKSPYCTILPQFMGLVNNKAPKTEPVQVKNSPPDNSKEFLALQKNQALFNERLNEVVNILNKKDSKIAQIVFTTNEHISSNIMTIKVVKKLGVSSDATVIIDVASEQYPLIDEDGNPITYIKVFDLDTIDCLFSNDKFILIESKISDYQILPANPDIVSDVVEKKTFLGGILKQR